MIIKLIVLLGLMAAVTGSGASTVFRDQGVVLQDFDGTPVDMTLTGSDGTTLKLNAKQISTFQMVAMRGQALIVYGTAKNARENESAALEEVAAWKSVLKSCPNCPPPDLKIVADTQVSAQELARKDVVLIGTSESNSLLVKLSNKLPIKVSHSTVDLGDAGKLYSVAMGRFIVPSPYNSDRFLITRFGSFGAAPDDIRWSVAYRWTAALANFWYTADYGFITKDGTLRCGYFTKPARDRWALDPKLTVTVPAVFQDPYSNWKSRETSHFLFRFAEGSSVGLILSGEDGPEWLSNWERCYKELSDRLQISLKHPIRIFFFDDWEESRKMAAVGCCQMSSFRDKRAAGLTDSAYDVVLLIGKQELNPDLVAKHELTHVLAKSVVPPKVPFLSEGLACFMEGDKPGQAAGKSVVQWEYDYLQEHKDLPRLCELFQAGLYNAQPATESYPIAASFTRFLLNRYGLQKYKAFYKAAAIDDPAAALDIVYSKPVEDIQKEWKQAVNSDCENLRKAGEIESRANEAYLKRDFVRARELAQETLKLHSDAVMAYFIIGASCNRISSTDTDTAIKALNNYIAKLRQRRSPEQPWAHIELGYAYDLDNDRQAALSSYHKAAEMPDDRGSRAEAKKRLKDPYRNGGQQYHAENTHNN